MKHHPLSIQSLLMVWSLVVAFFEGSGMMAIAQTVCPLQTFYEGTNLILRQSINTQDSTITIQMEYAGQAWLGFAFATDPDSMTPNVAIIGLPGDNSVQKYNLAGKSQSAVTLLTESTSSLTDTSITQNDTHTVLQFTQPLQPASEVSVTLDASNTFIWAAGTDNTLNYHAARGGSQATFSSQCNVNAPPPPAPPATEKTTAPAPAPAPAGGPLVFEDGAIEIAFEPDSAQGTLTVEMTYAGQGYIAFAFSEDQFMPNSLAVIALPDDGTGTPLKYTTNGRSGVEKLSQDQQTLTDASYMQNETHTYMKFTKKIQEGQEPTVSLTQNNYFLYAVGSSNELQVHSIRRAFEANPSEGGSAVSQAKDYTNLWKAHGACMAVAWAILVPLGIGSSVIRNLFPFLQKGGMWFQIHRILNSIGVALTIAGFGIAVHIFNQEKGSSAKHFSEERHHTMGLVIFIFAVLQALNGIFRPHVPQANPTKNEPSGPVEEPTPGEGEGDDSNDGQNAAETPQPAASEGKSTIRIAWEYFHKILGVVTVVLAWFNCDSGIELYDDRYDDFFLSEPALWGIICGITCTVLVLGVYLRFKK